MEITIRKMFFCYEICFEKSVLFPIIYNSVLEFPYKTGLVRKFQNGLVRKFQNAVVILQKCQQKNPKYCFAKILGKVKITGGVSEKDTLSLEKNFT